MFSTYKKEDVTILLKDISGLVKPLDTKEREKNIQQGIHYSEMLPIEYEPSNKYIEIYRNSLDLYSNMTAEAVAKVSKWIYEEKKDKIVLVSLARAGTPIGILIKRYLKYKYNINVKHYTISIIRGKGIDKNALNYILSLHNPEEIQFIDGWTGKGAIQEELNKSIKDYKNVNFGLAVLSDPAHVADKFGTQEDFLIANSCLNSTVSGLLSRTFLKDNIIKNTDFHGAVFYKNLIDKDLTYEFIEKVEQNFKNQLNININKSNIKNFDGIKEVKKICKDFNINNINFVKASIGEATRVLLRRVPWKILVYKLDDYEHLGHIYQLAKEKNIELLEYNLKNYKACGLIKNLEDS